MRFVVVALNLIAGILLGLFLVRMLGPDLGTPRRGVVFDALWVAFHVGPLAALALLAMVRPRLGFPRRPLVLVVITLVTAVPGVLLAWSEADSPANHSPGQGMLLFLVVCVQYLVAGAAWIMALAIGVFRRGKRNCNSAATTLLAER